MKPWIVWTFLFSCCAASGQSTANPQFEVASIKPFKPLAMGRVQISLNADGGMLRYSGASLKDCIRIAYRVKEFQVQGPDWLDHERFEITAKLPDGSSKDQIPEMLQALLAERFKLTIHREKKDHAIYALVAGKNGPKLKPAETPVEGGPPSRGSDIPRGARSVMMMRGPEGMHLKAPSATLASLAEMISRFAERPVVDMTGIAGHYDFDLAFTPETTRGMPPMGPGPGPSGPGPNGPGAAPSDAPVERAGTIQDAVQRYGLKLESRKAPMEILVVDGIEKVPTEN